MPKPKPSVLFVCVANSCRSQMAEAIAKSLVGDRWEIWSAGSAPGGRVHPVAVQMMDELGLDLSSHYSKGVDEVPARQWDYVVTMGCGDSCPTVPARQRLDWEIPDPTGMLSDEARGVRAKLRSLVEGLIKSHAST